MTRRRSDGQLKGTRRPQADPDFYSRAETDPMDCLHMWDEPANNQPLNSPEKCVADNSARWHRYRQEIEQAKRERKCE